MAWALQGPGWATCSVLLVTELSPEWPRTHPHTHPRVGLLTSLVVTPRAASGRGPLTSPRQHASAYEADAAGPGPR